jgi:hypothetical protein
VVNAQIPSTAALYWIPPRPLDPGHYVGEACVSGSPGEFPWWRARAIEGA